jgi:hypothetical protein
MNTLPTALNETLELLDIELPCELSDFIDSGHNELSDHVHETADGDADVIYYSRAEALYNSAEISERCEAEQMAKDCGSMENCPSMAERFTLLAYWITYNRLHAEIIAQVEVVVGQLEQAIETAEENHPYTTAADDLRDFQSILENL